MNIIRRIFGKTADEQVEQSTQQASRNHMNSETQEQASAPDSITTSEDSQLNNNAHLGAVKEEESEQNIAETEIDTEPMTNDISTPLPSGVTRPLETEVVAHQQHVRLTYGKASDVGMVRDNNQDACLAFQLNSTTVDDRPDFGFFIVADGMGGHHDGEKASALTVETVAAEMLENIYIPMLRNFEDGDRPTIVEALVSAAEKSNLAVIKGVPDGGTTLTAVAVVGNLAYLAHVGDSRAYLIHNGDIEQLTRDHSLVQRLIELNQLTADEAEEHPQKNVLYRAIGQSDNLEVERLIRPLPEGSQMLICSDGLWGLVGNNILLQTILEAPTPQAACNKLVSLANAEGGTDNITAIIFKIPSSK